MDRSSVIRRQLDAVPLMAVAFVSPCTSEKAQPCIGKEEAFRRGKQLLLFQFDVGDPKRQQCSELCKNFVPGKELEQGLKKCQMPCCLDISINELNLDQLLEYKKSVVEVISKIDKQIDELSRPSTTSANGIDLNIPIIK
ncbi:hypothetical protein NMG60_11006040 [Bertholletia excelsa]